MHSDVSGHWLWRPRAKHVRGPGRVRHIGHHGRLVHGHHGGRVGSQARVVARRKARAQLHDGHTANQAGRRRLLSIQFPSIFQEVSI